MNILVTTVFGATIIFSMGLGYAQGAEKDIQIPRVPSDQIEEVQALLNPFAPTPENIARGKEIYLGKGTCFTCHGNQGKGDGPAGPALEPAPRNFTNPKFHNIRTEGEMFWVIQNGSPGTGMISYSPAIITEEEAWLTILFERSLSDSPSP